MVIDIQYSIIVGATTTCKDTGKNARSAGREISTFVSGECMELDRI